MKKIFAILGLSLVATSTAFAQGTAQQGNERAQFIQSCQQGGGTAELCACTYSEVGKRMTGKEKAAVEALESNGKALGPKFEAHLRSLVETSAKACHARLGKN